MTSCRGPVIIRAVFPTCYYVFREAVLLARLVEAEIVSPYYGILINKGVGNPTVPLARHLGIKRVLGHVGRRMILQPL